jgi:hypothetical protein
MGDQQLLQWYGHITKGCQRREEKEDIQEKRGWKEYIDT